MQKLGGPGQREARGPLRMLGGGCSDRPLAGEGRMRRQDQCRPMAGQAVTPGEHRGARGGRGRGMEGALGESGDLR